MTTPKHIADGLSEAEWPSIDYDDGYPLDDDLESFTSTEPPLSFELAGRWLLRELPRASENMCCGCTVLDGLEEFSGKPVKQIEFSTFGWSGAESVIALINTRFDLKHFMVSWKRGGHYVFEVPVRAALGEGE